MRPAKLRADEIASHGSRAPEWRVSGDQIHREFEFADFAQAIAFVNRVAEVAESMNHHPDIDIRYNRVALFLTTHDAGGLTVNDFELARRIDAVVSQP